MLHLFTSALPPVDIRRPPPLHSHTDILLQLRSRTSDLLNQLTNEQDYFSTAVTFSMPGRLHWRIFSQQLVISTIKRHHSAWLIQSIWRSFKNNRSSPAFAPHSKLGLREMQAAELRGLRNLADRVLTNALKVTISLP